MAIVNSDGQSISYDASELIEELKEDIQEFGGDKLVWVVTEDRDGVTLYKDYEFADDPCDFKLKDGESVQKMTMTALMLLYEQETIPF